MSKTSILGIRVTPETREALVQIAAQEGRTISQICELLLKGGIQHYQRDGSKYLQEQIVRNKARAKPKTE